MLSKRASELADIKGKASQNGTALCPGVRRAQAILAHKASEICSAIRTYRPDAQFGCNYVGGIYVLLEIFVYISGNVLESVYLFLFICMTNRASMYVYLSVVQLTDLQIDGHVECFVLKLICTSVYFCN